jgi:hypothetical protein
MPIKTIRFDASPAASSRKILRANAVIKPLRMEPLSEIARLVV